MTWLIAVFLITSVLLLAAFMYQQGYKEGYRDGYFECFKRMNRHN